MQRIDSATLSSSSLAKARRCKDDGGIFIYHASAAGPYKPNILHLKRDVIAKLEKRCRKSRSTRLALHGGSKVRLDGVEDSEREYKWLISSTRWGAGIGVMQGPGKI